MLKLTVLVGAVLSLLGPSAAYASAAPSDEPNQDTRGIPVTLKASGGAGCPKDSVVVESQPDGESFFAMYRNLVARGGKSVNCQLTLNADVPEHVMFAIKAITNQGSVGIGNRGAARHTVTSYFSGKTQTLRVRNDVRGPEYGPWPTADEVSDEQLNWSPCGGHKALIIKNYLQVNGRSSDSARVMASLFELEARAC